MTIVLWSLRRPVMTTEGGPGWQTGQDGLSGRAGMTCGFGSRLACMLVLSAFGTGGGCQLTSSADDRPGESRSVPALPSGADYQAEAPDVLHVAVSPLVPRPTYRIESGDTAQRLG